MHPYRHPDRREAHGGERADSVVRRLGAGAKVFVVSWVLFRGVVAAYDGRAFPDLWLGAGVLLLLLWLRP